jgi:hypothetical protein
VLRLCQADSGRNITLLTGNDRFIIESALLGFCAIGCGMVADVFKKVHDGQWREAIEMRPRLEEFVEVIYADPVLDYRARCKVAFWHVGVIEHSRAYVRPSILQIDDTEWECILRVLVNVEMHVLRSGAT